MELYVGTSGYSYPEWKGPFYPEDLKTADMLGHYAEALRTVEINNTFYRLPKRHVVAGWREQVPEHFRFVIKASRRITHQQKLVDTADMVEFLSSSLDELGDQLGCVLLQLPRWVGKDLELLGRFLSEFPDRFATAFEFGSSSWLDDETAAVLARHGATFVTTDKAKGETPDPPPGCGWGYLRLRREEYGDDELAAWAERVRNLSCDKAFVFFKHEDAGAAPRLAARFEELWQNG